MSIEIPEHILTELKWLQGQMSQVRGHTPLDDPRRTWGDDFCKLAMHTVERYGVNYQSLSRALGLSNATVRLALGRRGYIPLPPSQSAYVGTLSIGKALRKKKTHCKRGHALEGDNLYFTPDGAHRRCRTCQLLHAKARSQGKKLGEAA